MKFQPHIVLDADFADEDAESQPSAAVSDGNSTTRKPPPKTPGKSKPSASVEQSGQSSPNESRINDLVAKADNLHKQSETSEKKLVNQRIEIGRVLLQLKNEVGHGNFIANFREWVKAEKLHFSLSTADRAMAYAELANDGKLRNVTNLAEAERIRKAEAKRKKAEKKTVKAAEDNDSGEPEPPPQAKHDRAKALQKAQRLAKPAIEECRSYEVETRIIVLEELIELLSEELEKLTEEPEP